MLISEYQDSKEGKHIWRNYWKFCMIWLKGCLNFMIKIIAPQCYVKHFRFQFGYFIKHIVETHHKMNDSHLGMK
jgi:hypothetical protein